MAILNYYLHQGIKSFVWDGETDGRMKRQNQSASMATEQCLDVCLDICLKSRQKLRNWCTVLRFSQQSHKIANFNTSYKDVDLMFLQREVKMFKNISCHLAQMFRDEVRQIRYILFHISLTREIKTDWVVSSFQLVHVDYMFHLFHPPSTKYFGFIVHTLGPRQNARQFPDDIFKRIFLNENIQISTKISLKLVPRGPINNILVLVQINGLAPTRRQAIIWTNDGQITDAYMRHSALPKWVKSF